MKEFNYELKSIKKSVGFKLDKETYTQDEVISLLKFLCMVIDNANGYKGI